MSARQSERGTALIAALLLVALMAAVAVQLIDVTRFAAFRTAQIDARTQAAWMARGARDLAEAAFLNAGAPDRAVMRSDELWLDGPVVFPVEGGQVTGAITDRNNCLNINALVMQTGTMTELEQLQARDEEIEALRDAFLRLSTEIGVPLGQAEQVLAQIIDWIDEDLSPEPGGAEDRSYGAYAPPYRAANQPFAELEELRALAAMTPALFDAYAPWLCALPTSVQPPLNINTLSLDQSRLLSALLHEDLDPVDAETVLFRRPPAGYDALDAVFSDPLFAQLGLSDAQKARLGLRSRWVEMRVSVRLADARFELAQLTELTEGGDLRRRSQRFGAL